MSLNLKKSLKRIKNLFNSKKNEKPSKKKVIRKKTKESKEKISKKPGKKIVKPKKVKLIENKKSDDKKKINKTRSKNKKNNEKKKIVKVKKSKINKVEKIKPKRKKTISRKRKADKINFFEKTSHNPIIEPNKNNSWESWQTFNPASLYIDNKAHFLYRAIGDGGISTLGYAKSDDPIKINERFTNPAFVLSDYFFNKLKKDKKSKFFSYSSGGSTAGCEDPRLTLIDDKIYLIFTTFSNWLYLRMTISSISKDDFINRRWHKWKKPVFISAPGEVHKNWVIFPDKINGQYAILTSISPNISISYHNSLNFSGKNFIKSNYQVRNIKGTWEEYRRGAGPPPIKTKAGWLLFYHAVEKNDTNKYKLGAMILDLNNPEKILYTAKHPILEPDMSYENNGFKPGIVYSCGTILIGDKLYIYYGGADTVVCVASTSLDKLTNSIVGGKKLTLKKKKLLKTKK